jgi:hypothetical protein
MAKKISQSLLEFAAPVLEYLPPDASFSQRHSVLQIVITVWNALVVARQGHQDVLLELYRRVEQMPEPGRSTVHGWVDILVERKRTLFAKDLRAVGNWELRVKTDGGLSLWAEARGLLP